ncbi:uncharacterized protein LOC111467730 isoform X2 [Cucurbita maxima]|uniref:Uncharacterized protein LOC111467730 isoform X2 n=1 Tax=Cucurbita maxima TaxID=3661 RepID=A0A6J1HXF7_CUCMA|nr:uncharacterized protein LOC111467730 isoform X2 [Cucurbita maxima]
MADPRASLSSLSSPPSLPPNDQLPRRFKVVWRVLLISNFALSGISSKIWGHSLFMREGHALGFSSMPTCLQVQGRKIWGKWRVMKQKKIWVNWKMME